MKKGIEREERDFSVNKVCFLHQSYLQEGSEIDFSKKGRPTDGFLYLNACDAQFFFRGGKSLFAESGNCIYLPKGSRYRVVFSKVFDKIPSFLINCALSCEGKDAPLSKQPFLLPKAKSVKYQSVFSSLANRVPSSAKIKSAVWTLLALWIDSEKEEDDQFKKVPKYLKDAKEYIEQNVAEEYSIAFLSRKFGVSSSYFRKEFKKYFSLSPKEYSLQCRLDAACNYLETGEVNVSEVSKILSFSGPAYFSRLFKEKKGISPIEFMKKSRS